MMIALRVASGGFGGRGMDARAKFLAFANSVGSSVTGCMYYNYVSWCYTKLNLEETLKSESPGLVLLTLTGFGICSGSVCVPISTDL